MKLWCIVVFFGGGGLDGGRRYCIFWCIYVGFCVWECDVKYGFG